MLYPACPNCRSKNVESNEPDAIDFANRSASQSNHSQAMTGHPHPWVRALTFAIMAGRQVYKRVPGGGEKRCTDCYHTFR